jgi:hypothetical protein
VCAVILVTAIAIAWLYDSGRRGVKACEQILTVMVAMLVGCSFGVFFTHAASGG